MRWQYESEVVEYDLSSIKNEVAIIQDMDEDEACDIYQVNSKEQAIFYVISEGYRSRFFCNYAAYIEYIKEVEPELAKLYQQSLKNPA